MDDNVLLNAVMRRLGAAWRSSRLYPANSPMTLEAARLACQAIEEYLQTEPSLKLDVMREGFILRGLEGVLTAPGIPDLADALGLHGVGELHFVAPPTPEEVSALVSAAALRPQDTDTRDHLRKALAQAGVGSIKVVAVMLSKIETPPEIPEDEADRFLAELTADSNRLAVWLRSLLASDDEGLTEGILLLAGATEDVRVFGRTMAAAFLELESTDKDRLLEASIGLEPIRHVMTEMVANLSEVELVAAIRSGRYSSNPMALSYALAKLPVGDRYEALAHETEIALRAADTSEEQIAFLARTAALRRAPDEEPPLTQADPAYLSTLENSQLQPHHLASLKEITTSRTSLDANSVATLLRLFELTDTFSSFSRVLGALARSVPRLLEERSPELAMLVVHRISAQGTESSRPWPQLHDSVEEAMAEVCTERTMAALLTLSSSDTRAVEYAKELVSLTGDRAAHSLAATALASDAEDAMPFAEEVMGRRLAEILAPEAANVDERNVARLVALFAHDGGPSCVQAIATLTARPEDRVRAETARGLAAVGGSAMIRYMPQLLRDASYVVSGPALRVLARNGSAEAVTLLGNRLAEIDSEKDMPAAREIISLLALSPSGSAASALKRIVEQGSVFKRIGWRSEMRRLATEALARLDARGP